MIVVVGLSHQNATIEVRERFAIGSDRVPDLLRELVARPEVGEALLISTCNRVELVAAAASGAALEHVALACRSALSAAGVSVRFTSPMTSKAQSARQTSKLDREEAAQTTSTPSSPSRRVRTSR